MARRKHTLCGMQKIEANFLTDEGARGIITALQAAGEECRFVGGCVRDALVGLQVGDIDLATTALPEKVMEILPVTGFAVKPVGLAHGVVLAVRDGRSYEIATLREDIITDGRHAVVAYTRDWALDAQRRDFTMNALSADITGQLFDVANGAADLSIGRVRFIGNADARIKEDYLRIMRFYRFHAKFGRGDMDMVARTACRDNRIGMQQISRERMTEELQKLLLLQNPMPACVAMTEDKILSDIIPFLGDIAALAKLLSRAQQYNIELPWFARLFAWAGFARAFEESQLDAFIFMRTARAEMKLWAGMDLQDLPAALYYSGVMRVGLAALLRASDDDLPDLMQQINAYKPTMFPMKAEDILGMGIAPGPRLGDILRETENWWVKGGMTADNRTCKNYAETLATVSKA
jgi:poly(A) polymerase